MSRGWLLLLCLVLFAWQPLTLAGELAATLPSVSMRGAPAVLELLAHAAVAALSIAAAWALWIENPVGPQLAAVALTAVASAGVQSLYWSVLPRNTKPDDKLPLAILAVMHSAIWLVYLIRSRRLKFV